MTVATPRGGRIIPKKIPSCLEGPSRQLRLILGLSEELTNDRRYARRRAELFQKNEVMSGGSIPAIKINLRNIRRVKPTVQKIVQHYLLCWYNVYKLRTLFFAFFPNSNFGIFLSFFPTLTLICNFFLFFPRFFLFQILTLLIFIST